MFILLWGVVPPNFSVRWMLWEDVYVFFLFSCGFRYSQHRISNRHLKNIGIRAK